ASTPCHRNRAWPLGPGPRKGLLQTTGRLALRFFAESSCVTPGAGWVRRACLDRVGIGFAGTDADGLLQIDDEDLADADLAGIGGLADGFDHAVKLIVGNGHVDFYLGQKVDDIFRTAIQLGVPLLAAEAFDLG